ncbi:N-acetylmuramoyl-L-alanine amidase [Clostridium tunisiense]|uniref:N-acetylmuramoyl-L-alanine amidase n=1 Tax=Clostridium tunisiense TaxID=219748 RepID=UPI0002DFBEF7|nr:N-acetylmuramoyl-L-alanine amidase [Clostridium tunisiense]
MSSTITLAIDIGHNAPYDIGAMGIESEDKLNLEVGSRLIRKCIIAGIRVVDCMAKGVTSHGESLRKRVLAANSEDADYFISIHHNACPGGYGTEVLCYPEERAENFAKAILPEIVELGFRNRGVKHRPDLYVLKKTKMPAILVECAFCDSEIDMKNYNTEAMAEAIFRGICKFFNISMEYKEENPKQQVIDNSIYHTVVSGDTLWALTRKYGVTLCSIIELNNIKNVDLIYPGQKLRIK